MLDTCRTMTVITHSNVLSIYRPGYKHSLTLYNLKICNLNKSLAIWIHKVFFSHIPRAHVLEQVMNSTVEISPSAHEASLLLISTEHQTLCDSTHSRPSYPPVTPSHISRNNKRMTQTPKNQTSSVCKLSTDHVPRLSTHTTRPYWLQDHSLTNKFGKTQIRAVMIKWAACIVLVIRFRMLKWSPAAQTVWTTEE